MIGAIYKKKGEEYYIRMYSSSEQSLRLPLEQFELHKIYVDTKECEREFSQLEKKAIKNE